MAAQRNWLRVIVLYNNLPKISRKWRDEVAALSESTAEAIAATAQSLAPVDTGELVDSIHTRPAQDRRLQHEVVVGADYGHYVEYGTYKMQAQPFLIPAFELHAPEYIENIKGILNGISPRGRIA